MLQDPMRHCPLFIIGERIVRRVSGDLKEHFGIGIVDEHNNIAPYGPGYPFHKCF